jgi:hypothetical protein
MAAATLPARVRSRHPVRRSVQGLQVVAGAHCDFPQSCIIPSHTRARYSRDPALPHPICELIAPGLYREAAEAGGVGSHRAV